MISVRALAAAAALVAATGMPPPDRRAAPRGDTPRGVPGASPQANGARPPAPPRPGDPCPLHTPADWQKFLEGVASQERLVDTCELQDCDQDYHDYIRDTVATVMNACA